MGFLDKFLGAKAPVPEVKSAAPVEVQAAGDFGAALSLHLRGELDAAQATYARFEAENPVDNLAAFFSAAIVAERGEVTAAAEKLRMLSARIASDGESISRIISTEVAAVLDGQPPRKVPAVAELILALGEALKGERLLQESAVCFEIAAGLTPDNAHVLHKLGDTLHDLRLYDYAETVLLEAIRLAQHHFGALYTYAVLLQDLGRGDEAIPYYERAVKLVPTHVNCRNNFAAALMRGGRLDEALEQCTQAAELDPEAPLVQINLGNLHQLREEYGKARACFERAASLNPGLAQAFFGLGSVEQLSGGSPEKARDCYVKAVQLNPSVPMFYHALANCMAAQGDPEALSHYAAAAVLDNGLRNLHRDFACACLSFGRREEGMEHLRIALQQDPEDAAAREILSRAEGEATA